MKTGTRQNNERYQINVINILISYLEYVAILD